MQDNQSFKSISVSIGRYQVLAIPTGIFGLDGGSMFGTVPKTLWQKTNPADENNRIQLEARALLLKSPQRNILIDDGVGGDFVEKYGEKLGNKFAEIYAVKKGGVSLESSLKRHGLSVEDITDVILTHLHFDHAGGSTCFRDGQISPTFPNAKYYVQKRNYVTALNPNIREKASYLGANFKSLMDSGVLNLIEGTCDNLFPNISMYLSDGHTLGLQVVKISDGKNGIVYGSDLIPTSSHIRLPFVMGYDLEPLKLIEEKRKLLDEVVKNNWYLFFEHDPFMDTAQIKAENNDFFLKEGFFIS